jgi:hypothetical protein
VTKITELPEATTPADADVLPHDDVAPTPTTKRISFANARTYMQVGLVKADGTVAMAADLDMGGNAIANVGLVDGVDVSAHGSRHDPAGADPVTVAAPVATGRVNAAGSANSLARSDHVHDAGTVSPTSVSSSPHTLLNAEDLLFVDTTSGAISIQLPTPSARHWTIKKIVQNTSGITLLQAVAENIEGAAASFLLRGSDDNTIRGSWTVASDGTDWWVL